MAGQLYAERTFSDLQKKDTPIRDGKTYHRRQFEQTVSRINTENTSMREGVWQSLRQDPIDNSGLIGALKTKPVLRFLFEDPKGGGAWEGRTLEEHTDMVLYQSQKYIRRDEWTSPLLTFEEFNLMLSLHDIGKPFAVEFTGKTRSQHLYNSPILQGTLDILGVEQSKIALMTSLVSDDILAKFINRGDTPLQEIADNLHTAAMQVGVDPKAYAHLRRLYQLCDSSSYTLDAKNGEYDHDDCFTFGTKNGNGKPTIAYASDLEEKWQQLMLLL